MKSRLLKHNIVYSLGFQKISDACVRAGNDLMLGYGTADSNKFTDTDSATCVLAMKTACKNILYTVGNSGYYKAATAIDNTGGMSKMTITFLLFDISSAIVLIGVELIVLIRYKRKKSR